LGSFGSDDFEHGHHGDKESVSPPDAPIVGSAAEWLLRGIIARRARET
jgi:hypothetical protein